MTLWELRGLIEQNTPAWVLVLPAVVALVYVVYVIAKGGRG